MCVLYRRNIELGLWLSPINGHGSASPVPIFAIGSRLILPYNQLLVNFI